MYQTIIAVFQMDEPSRIDQLGHHFRKISEAPARPPVNWGPLLLFGLLVLSAAALLVFLVALRRAKKGSFNHPGKLFSELCNAHHLSRQERWFLDELAKHNNKQDSAEVFVEPRLFAAGLLPRVLERQPALMMQLREKLFGDLL